MKRRTFFKGICMMLASSLLAAVLPMGVMAEENTESVTILAEYDTYVRDYNGTSGSKRDGSYNAEKTLYSTARSGNNKYTLLGFNLKALEKDGYEVDSAKITVTVNGYKRANGDDKVDTGAHSFSVYSLGNIDYTSNPGQTYNTAFAGKDKGYISSTVIAPEDTIEKYDKYEFDVSSYFDGVQQYTDDYMFAIYPDAITDEEKGLSINNVDATFFALDNGVENYSPSLTVTYKAVEKVTEKTVTIKAEADTYIRQAGGDNTNKEANKNFGKNESLWSTEGGNSLWDNEVWTRFDLSGAVPNGGEILSAKVRFYATETVKCQSYATKSYLALNLYSISTEWNENELTYATAYPEVSVAGTAAFATRRTDEVKIADAKVTGEVLEAGKILQVNDWIEFDITEYLKGKSTLSKENFVMLPLHYNDSIYFHSKEYNGGEYAPQIVITYMEPAEPEVEITKPENYDYSFAVIGDTEALVGANPQYLSNTYDWLIENADEEKLKFVFGLGDVTSSNNNMDWAIYRAVTQKLDNVLPYSVVRGEKDNITKYNSAFPYDDYKSVISGTYDGTMLNTYRYLTVNGIKYLIFTLDYGASDDVLVWAGRVIENNIDSNVIITTHAYLGKDGTLLDSNDTNAPSASGAGYNDGDDMWDKLIKNHKNIVLVLSGHDSSEKIVYTQSNGVYGNKVNQLLVNPELIDEELGGCGLVAMLYFSEEGKKVDVRYYSTVRGEYYKAVNQFSFDMNVIASSITPATPPVIQTGAISFDVDLTANEYEGKVVAALYDKAYNLIAVSVYDAKRTINVSFPENVTSDFATVYWLKDFETIIPICSPETLNIAE